MEGKEYFHREDCRLCNSSDLALVLALEDSPIGDAYIAKEYLNERQHLYPLKLYLCNNCGYVQLLDIINPEILFKHYTFETASSGGLIKHFETYAAEIAQKYLTNGAFALEIGSNDGTFLQFLKDKGFTVLGVDPAERIAKQASNRGIPTIADFFSKKLGAEIIADKGKPSVVIANNVYAHADNMRDITEGIKLLLAPEGVFIFEVSYLVDVIERFLFDTIYHEHLSYYAVKPLKTFLDSVGLELFHVTQVGTKGGSIRCFVQHTSGPHTVDTSVECFLELERKKGYHTKAPYMQLENHLITCRETLHRELDKYSKLGKKIAGFGASVTATTLMYHFQLQEKLSVIIDDNPKKSGLFTPYKHIPVVTSDILYDSHIKPDVVVILVWQYTDPIVARHKKYLEDGGIFYVPLPEVSHVGHS